MATVVSPASGPDSTSAYYLAVTPSDVTSFASACRALYVGGAGVVAAVRTDGTAVNFTAPAGAVLPVVAIRVNSTNTTATGIVALF